jgi:23S rRNA pseudouridine2605 synthase
MTERLQKILSQWGIASRRQAEQMILDGRVCLNGEVVQIGQKANPKHDWIEVDGTRIHPGDRPKPIYLLLHKPAGVVSTCHDPKGRPTVIDLIAPLIGVDSGVHPVGRLDTASTGALILTNNGAVTFGLTHPRHAVSKTYQVWVEGSPSLDALEQWRQGILLEEQLTLPATVRVLEQGQTQTLLEVILREGRNRQIRRVAEQLGHPVRQLHRVSIGSIELGKLPSGQYRYLRESEIKFLQVQAKGFEPALPDLKVSEPKLKIGVNDSKGYKL